MRTHCLRGRLWSLLVPTLALGAACADAPLVGATEGALAVPPLAPDTFFVESVGEVPYSQAGPLLYVTIDNPLVANHGRLGTARSNGQRLEIVHAVRPAAPLAVAGQGADLRVWFTSDEGPWVSGAPVGSVDDTITAWADPGAEYRTGDDAQVQARGARLGYQPTKVNLVAVDGVGGARSLAPDVTLALAPSTYLVPLEVWVVRSPGHPQTGYRRTYQDGLWDQGVDWDTVRSTHADSPGILRLIQHTFVAGADVLGPHAEVGFDGVPYQPYADRPSGYWDTPDSVWARCGVQFRMIAYHELSTDDRHVLPLAFGDRADGEDAQHFAADTLDRTPCLDNVRAIERDPRHRVDTPFVVVMQHATFTDGVELGFADPRAPAICVPTIPTNGPPPLLYSHELGHLSGLADCRQGEACSIMEAHGGDGAPNPRECAEMRSWAYDQARVFAGPARTSP